MKEERNLELCLSMVYQTLKLEQMRLPKTDSRYLAIVGGLSAIDTVRYLYRKLEES